MEENGARRHRRGLAGANLWRDPRTGIYYWRRVHPLSGKRFRRSTGTKILRLALRRIQAFEEELQREIAGLSNYGEYRRPLADFLEPFLASLSCGDKRKTELRMELERAFRLLGLSCLADIENFIKVERKLLRLQGTDQGRFKRNTLARCFQAPLKQFSSYLAGRREILADHLAAWPRMKREVPARRRRALTPEEFARILAASDCLDAMLSRKYPTRPVWMTLLMAAPRISALAALDVRDLDREKGRLLFKGNNVKRAGAGALDDRTLDEITAYVGSRTDGPLFLSPKGTRRERCRSLDQWRDAASLAFVDLEWPDDEQRELRFTYLVHLSLSRGRVTAAMGGPLSGPNRPGPAKRAAREKLAGRIAQLEDAIREKWQGRMKGIDQHCLRMTHRTWALAAGVPEILIDRQLGHTSPAGQAALHAAWSLVGRAHYTDMNFLAADAKRSAEGVRGMLDGAEAEFKETLTRGESALGTPAQKRRRGIA